MNFRFLRKNACRLLIGFVLLTVPVFAQQAEPAETAKKPSVLVWEVANFVILVGLLGWMVVKTGRPYFAARSQGIAEGLAAGEKAKAEADRRAAEVQARLANLESEVAAMRATAKMERERESDRIRRETQAEIARIHQHVEHEIESAGKQARIAVQRAAARLAVELAESKVQARMSPEMQALLLRGFLADLPRKGAHLEASLAANVE